MFNLNNVQIKKKGSNFVTLWNNFYVNEALRFIILTTQDNY